MADLAALLLLVASGWWDGALRRLGVGRWQALVAGALVLAAGWANIGVPGPIPVRVNVGGCLPALAMLAATIALPEAGGRIAAAGCAAACLLFGLGGWTGPLAAVGLPLVATVAAAAVAGIGPAGLLSAAGAPALAGLARWIVAYSDRLPGTVWIGGGTAYAAMVLSVVAAGLALVLAAGAAGKHVSR